MQLLSSPQQSMQDGTVKREFGSRRQAQKHMRSVTPAKLNPIIHKICTNFHVLFIGCPWLSFSSYDVTSWLCNINKANDTIAKSIVTPKKQSQWEFTQPRPCHIIYRFAEVGATYSLSLVSRGFFSLSFFARGFRPFSIACCFSFSSSSLRSLSAFSRARICILWPIFMSKLIYLDSFSTTSNMLFHSSKVMLIMNSKSSKPVERKIGKYGSNVGPNNRSLTLNNGTPIAIQ